MLANFVVENAEAGAVEGSAAGHATLSGPAPSGGVIVQLSFNGPEIPCRPKELRFLDLRLYCQYPVAPLLGFSPSELTTREQ